MIRYALACDCGHQYDAWFGSSSDFDEQAKRGLVECPSCGAATVRKQVMAPNVATGRKRERAEADRMREVAGHVRKHIKDNFDHVGQRFPEEARAIHLGEAPARAIYGEASLEDAKALKAEGVEVCPLPPILAPRDDKKLN